MRTINKIILHCSDTPNFENFKASDINEWHIERGWKSIGYHYVIDISGEIERGRYENEVGAHCHGHNSNSIGICLIGRDQFTNEQWISLNLLVNRLVNQYNIKEENILGHCELDKNKTCPNFSVKKWRLKQLN